MDSDKEEKDREIEEAFKKSLERWNLEDGIHKPNAVHESSAAERMPPVIAQKRKIGAMTNCWIQILDAICESKHCTPREAADFMTETIHKEHEKFLEKERAKNQFGPLPKDYDPRNDPNIVR